MKNISPIFFFCQIKKNEKSIKNSSQHSKNKKINDAKNKNARIENKNGVKNGIQKNVLLK